MLPDNMLACFSPLVLLIYEIPLLQTRRSAPDDSVLSSPAVQPLWRLEPYPTQVYHGGLSRPYVFRDITRFTTCSGNAVHGLAIPRDKTQAPYHFKFMDIPSIASFSCKYEEIFGKENSIASLLSIQWPDSSQNLLSGEPSGSLVTKAFTETGETYVPLVDEELARVIVIRGHGFIVMDFALCL